MNSPAILFSRFLTACALGASLGFLFDLLSPLPRYLRHLGDGIFVTGLFACGIYLGFAVCEGDLRPVYSAGLFTGAVIWHRSFGRLLRPLISYAASLFQRLFFCLFRLFKKIITFILIFLKKTFALPKK